VVGARLLLAAALIRLLGAALPAEAAVLEARVDRRDLARDERLVLTLELRDSDIRLRAEGVDPNVDLTVLARDFDVGRVRSSFRYRLERARGRAVSRLEVELFPRRAGDLRIPAFEVAGLRTQPIPVRVHPLPVDRLPELRLTAGAEPEHPWPGQAVRVWVALHARVAVERVSLGDVLRSSPVPLELMEHRRLPREEGEERWRGARYRVLRQAWVLHPRRAGRLEVLLPDLWVETADGRRRRLAPLPLALEVREPPPGAAGLPVGRPELEARWPAGPLAVGRLAVASFTVAGPYPGGSLPERLPVEETPGVELLADRAALEREPRDGLPWLRARYHLAIRPLRPGPLALPAVRIPYLDPATGSVRVAELRPPPLEAVAPPAPPPPDPAALSRGTAGKEGAAAWPWMGLSAVLGAAWLLTLGLLLGRRRAAPTTPAPPPPAPPPAPRPAGLAGDPLLDRLRERLGDGGLRGGLRRWEARHGPDPELRRAVETLLRARYGGAPLPEPERRRLGRLALERLEAAPAPARRPTSAWDPDAPFRPPGSADPLRPAERKLRDFLKFPTARDDSA